MANNPLSVVREQIEWISRNPKINPQARLDAMLDLRDKAETLMGDIDTYIADTELEVQAQGLTEMDDLTQARENADLRDEMLRRHLATPEQLDEMGYLSHEELDRLADEGLLEEGLRTWIKKAWSEFAHPRNRTGQWIDKPDALKAIDRELGPAQPEVAQNPIQRLANDDRIGTLAIDPKLQLQMMYALGVEAMAERDDRADRMLQGREKSLELHTSGDRIKEERRMVHARIIGRALVKTSDGKPTGVALLLGEDHFITQKLDHGVLPLTDMDKRIIREAAAARRKGGKPQALFMAGGPASGKSTALDQNPHLFPDAAVEVAADWVKEGLPEYRALLAFDAHERRKDRKSGFAGSAVHDESSIINAQIMELALKLGLNIAVDGTGDGKKPTNFRDKYIMPAHERGYESNVLYVNAQTDLAAVRMYKRGIKEGRFLLEDHLRQNHRRVSENWHATEELLDQGIVSNIKIYDSSYTKSREDRGILVYDNGIVNDDLYWEFVNKAHEPRPERDD